MKLQGDHKIVAPAQKIWDLLMDPVTLARITPGIDYLESVGTDQYDAVAEVKIGPVKGKFKGKVDVKNKKEPEAFTLVIDQKSKIGNAKAEVDIHLKEIDPETTTVRFDGDVRMSGILASTGQRVIGSVVSMLSRQFFTALENEVTEEKEEQ